MRHFFKALIAIIIGFSTLTAQELEKTWQFDAIEDSTGSALFEITENDSIVFSNGEFYYGLGAKNNLKASGDYIYQNNLLVFYYSQPNDTIRRYKINTLTDSTLVFTEKGISYKFKTPTQVENLASVEQIEDTATIIPSQGFSMDSLWRGVLGMVVLIFIAFLFRNILLPKVVSCI